MLYDRVLIDIHTHTSYVLSAWIFRFDLIYVAMIFGGSHSLQHPLTLRPLFFVLYIFVIKSIIIVHKLYI
jgi:hypothetical protein